MRAVFAQVSALLPVFSAWFHAAKPQVAHEMEGPFVADFDEKQTVDAAKRDVAAYFGFTHAVSIEVAGGRVFEVPNPALLNDEQQERWEELQFELQSCDKDDDGEPLIPYQFDGVRMVPPYNVRLAVALFGEDGYKEYHDGGGIASQVALEWARMNREFGGAE